MWRSGALGAELALGSSMLKLALLAAVPVLAIAGTAHAQEAVLQPEAPTPIVAPAIVMSQPQPVEGKSRAKRGVGRRTAGIVLTVVSIVDALAGGALTAYGGANGQYGGLIGGPTLLGEGLILSFIGPPLWASGGKLAGQGPRASQTLGFDVGKDVTLEPNATGFTLRF